MRTVSSSIMAALVVVALFWGNCFSCPQALLVLTMHQPAHQCCHKTKAPVPTCDTHNLQNFVKADAGAHVPALPVAAQVSLTTPLFSSDGWSRVAPEYTPPDLLSLHSVFRI